ncbi:MAG: hypothetical protein JNK87_42665 [Bryobacterales bacterium]|nr:hypothetical protein [Bryobacterales bacterium]
MKSVLSRGRPIAREWNYHSHRFVVLVVSRAGQNSSWINISVLIGAGSFLFALFLSAVFDPRIRLLHALQALIYIVVILLTRKTSSWGFGAGCIIALFWNYVNLFVTTFFKAGLQQLSILLQTGQLHRPDLLIAVVAVAGHFLLIIACLVGFIRTGPGGRSWSRFLGGGALAVGYFIAIVITTGRQYIGLLKRVFHL